MPLEIDRLAKILSAVRERQPIVHAITNWVTANDVASALHAIGARPIMAFTPEEVKEIVSGADALVLNLGTPSPLRIESMLRAGHQTALLGRPVIFDPVGVGASPFRMNASKRITCELHLTVIKGNRAEIGFLSGRGGKLAGIDAVAEPEDLGMAAEHLSRTSGAVVAASGPQDLIVYSGKKVIVENGHAMMARVTGLGCILTALIGAFAAVENDPLAATVGAVAFLGLAGERAAVQAKGPGTFKIALFDTLFTLGPEEMVRGIRVKEETLGG
ncbi:MAG: hydroxyethylthiazole kinase [Thermodesulfobacteriota bacterium]